MRYLRLAVLALALSGVVGIAAYARLEFGPACRGEEEHAAERRPENRGRVGGRAAAGRAGEPRVGRLGRADLDGHGACPGRRRGGAQLVQEGQIVHRGDLLFKIDDREIKAAARQGRGVAPARSGDAGA